VREVSANCQEFVHFLWEPHCACTTCHCVNSKMSWLRKLIWIIQLVSFTCRNIMNYHK
jgi:hypothetical protein